MSPRPTSRLRGIRRKGTAGLLAGVLFMAGVFQISVAAAQDAETEEALPPPELLLVDAGDNPAAVVRAGIEPTELSVEIGGTAAELGSIQSIADTDQPILTTIIIDNSAASEEFIPSFVAAARAYIEGADSDENISIWTSGGLPRLRVGLNNAHERTSAIVGDIVASAGGNYLYDTVREGALELEGGIAGSTNVIILSGALDGGSNSTLNEARGAVQSVNGSAFGIATTDAAIPAVRSIVSSTYGGAFAGTADPAVIEGYGASVSQVVNGTYRVAFTSDVLAENNQIVVSIDGTTIRATYDAGALSYGSALAPFVDNGSGGIPGFGFLSGDTGRMLGLIFGALAAGLGAYSLVMLMQKDESALNSVLQAYNDPYATNLPDEESGESGISKNAILKRAVEMSEDLAERRGFLTRIEATLERADMPLRGGEALTAGVGITVLFAVVGLFLMGSLPGMLVFGVFGALIPAFAVRMKASRRQKAFMAQLPDTLNLLSSTLKAGYSFMQGVEAVSQEIDDPMGGELRRIVTEAQLGRPLEDAMDASAERMGSPDFAWAVMAVKIQREVGGNLSELLLTVAETMTERERLRRDVASLTAEGKMSAIILGALPILLGLAMWAINPEYINTLFTDSFGKVLLGLSIFAALSGFAWMKKIINIEI